MPGPGVCVGGCLRVITGGWPLAGGFRGVGDAAPYGLPGMGGDGSLPLIRPCGATFPQRGRQGLLLAAAQASAGRRGRRHLRFARERAVTEGRGGVGAPRPTDGDMETLWGLRGHPFPGRRAVGAGHARPGGLRGHPSTVRSVGRGLDPSAGGYPGDGCWRKPPRGVGDAAPYGLPGKGGSGRSRRGGGTPPYGWGDMETLWGLREQSFPGRRAVGAGHARPEGLRRQASTVRSVGRGLDPSAGVGGSGSLRGW